MRSWSSGIRAVENGDGGDGAAEMMVALRIPVMLVPES
jgi:hypothetical protein